MQLLLGSGGFSTPERKRLWTEALSKYLGELPEILFIPYALADYDHYTRLIVERGFHAGRSLKGIHTFSDPMAAIESAQAIYIGGGNSFRLLHTLYQRNLLDPIRKRVLEGKSLYIGVSAGTNMACPTLKTTNDMPIAEPPSFDALGLIPFQINPHYFPGRIHFRDAGGTLIEYAGETRDDRIREFHEMNATPVLGLWEGAILERNNAGRYFLTGEGGARLFHRGKAPLDFISGTELTDALHLA